MKIGIIGSGNVGGALGKRWSQAGHQVLFSSRDPQSETMRRLVGEAGSGAAAGTVAEAAQFGEVILLATPWPGTHDALRSAGD